MPIQSLGCMQVRCSIANCTIHYMPNRYAWLDIFFAGIARLKRYASATCVIIFSFVLLYFC